MIERILELRSQSLSITQIAQECNLTVGQVKYQLRKFKEQTSESADIFPEDEEREIHSSVSAPQSSRSDESSAPQPAAHVTKQKPAASSSAWLLSSFYGENVVKLMPQSPTILFAYWEITWNRMRMVASYLKTDYRDIQKGLRVYDVTDRYFDGANAHSHTDIIVHPEATSWYITNVQPGRTYIADFGLYHEGRFCPILRSQPVATARNTPARWGEPLLEPAPSPQHPAWFENFTSYSIHSK